MKTIKPEPAKEKHLTRQADIRRGILKTLETWNYLRPGYWFGYHNFFNSVVHNSGRIPEAGEMEQALRFLENAGRIQKTGTENKEQYYIIPLCTK